jgi:predicted outer membrane protein
VAARLATGGKMDEQNMNQQKLLAKLNQIVEQAQLTLQDPRSLTTERQKMIIALARFISAEMSHASTASRVPDA